MPLDLSFDHSRTLAEIFAESRAPMPTDMSTAELRQLDAEIRRGTMFSARMTNARAVQGLQDGLQALLRGEANQATVRSGLQSLGDLLAYDPARGFPGDDPNIIPPAEAGSLRDLFSESRLKLILDTQESMTANYGYLRAGNEDSARWQFPAWELIRLGPARVPRGFRVGPKRALIAVPDDAWPARFEKAGGALLRGRLVAAKDAPVWTNLGNSELFPDGLDNPYPPFAFGSHWGWRQVPRQEAIDLGAIPADYMPEFTDPGFQASTKLNAEAFAPDILQALRADVAAELDLAA